MTPIDKAIDQILSLQLERMAWIPRAADQVRRWKAEDEANGQHWETTERNPRQAEQAAGLNK